MFRKRLWIALLAIPVCLISVLIIGAQRSHPANAGGVVDPTCVSSLPCIEYDNNGTGPGIRGISVSGNGVGGGTKFNSTSTTNGKAGIFGNDQSTSGSFNSGVKGMSTKGNGVLGQSTNNSGVEGVSTNADGVRALSTNGPAVDAFSNNSYGVSASTGNTSGGVAGVRGVDESTGNLDSGVAGFSTNGIGVQGVSSNGVGVNAVGGGLISGLVTYPALSVNTNGNSNVLIAACDTPNPNPCSLDIRQPVPTFKLFNDGTLEITGHIFTGGSCHSGCASSPSAGEKRVRLFTPQESLPTVEDFGQAQLVGGRTYVRIDLAFANTMDDHAAYMVLITPEGDSNGLYVVNKTLAGFEVHENRGGRSTLAFSYRIVAKPFGEHPVRLQMITVSRPGKSLPPSRVR